MEDKDSIGGGVMHALSMASVAFALFAVCPRMVGIANIIVKYTRTDIILVSIVGTILSIPLVMLMAWILKKYGLIPTLLFTIVTDILAAVSLRGVSFNWIKSGIEIFVIAIFVIIGVKVGAFVAHLLP